MSTETTMLSGNTQSTGTENAGTAATETTATAAATPENATATTQQAAPASDTSTETKTDPAETKTEPVKNAPEKYELKAPEGAELNPEVAKQFEDVARELDLSQEAAQKVIEAMAPKIAAAQQAQIQAVQTQWITDAKADKEFGGDKLNENLAVAKKALDAFGSPELKNLLETTGLGNHPEIIRTFFRAGQKISSGNLVTGGGSTQPQGKNLASILYPNQA